MLANRTEGFPPSNGTVQTLDSPTAICFPTTFPEVEEEKWGSFYYSLKVSVLPSILNTDFR